MLTDAILIGAGQRGADVYGRFALENPTQIRFRAVSDPDPIRRQHFADDHDLSDDQQFASWESLLDQPQMGQVAVICTPDRLHAKPAMAAMRAGYHILLEKPMATTLDDCKQLVAASEVTGRQLHICHVLRYTSHFKKMREIIRSGALGEITNVDHRENVAFYHMAHSFVRGNWGQTAESSPMILAKCCHDLDILVWLLDQRCEHLGSVGRLSHFRPEHAPEGAPLRCSDGCPSKTAVLMRPAPYISIWSRSAAMLPIRQFTMTTVAGLDPSLLRTQRSKT